MAKNKKSKKRATGPGTAVVTTAEHDTQDAGKEASAQSSGGDNGGRGLTGNGYGDPPAGGGGGGVTTGGGGLFAIYKSGQGYYTRMGTAIGTGVIAAFGAHYLYSTISSGPAWQLGVPMVFLAVCGAIIFWVVGVSHRTNDFFISTEGEMKKVSWSSRREVIGSTKVVLVFTFLMAFLLFFVDIIFMAFFSWIGVLDIDLLEAIGLKAN